MTKVSDHDLVRSGRGHKWGLKFSLEIYSYKNMVVKCMKFKGWKLPNKYKFQKYIVTRLKSEEHGYKMYEI